MGIAINSRNQQANDLVAQANELLGSPSIGAEQYLAAASLLRAAHGLLAGPDLAGSRLPKLAENYERRAARMAR